VTVRCAAGCLLETPSIRRYFLWEVTIRPVRAISREVLVTPQRPYAGPLLRDGWREDEMVRTLRRRREAGGNDQPRLIDEGA
jgi:hypothetical protein